jgi:hypothetical protein
MVLVLFVMSATKAASQTAAISSAHLDKLTFAA